MYGLPDNYQARLEPQYFDDVLDDSSAWQADVYRLAAFLARSSQSPRLIDLGCGQGHKLAQFTGQFALIGYDYGPNIAACKQRYNGAVWLEANLNAQVIEPEIFFRSVTICADVIEHLPDPLPLIETLRGAAQQADYVLISTPDRARVYKQPQFGPPGNPYHVREWTHDELIAYFRSEHLPIIWHGWTVSNDVRPDQVWTSLVVLSSKYQLEIRHNRYESAAP